MASILKQLETNLDELRGVPAPRATDADRREKLVFGFHDRLLDHGHATVNVVLAPALPDGSPDFGHADPTNLESLPADEWPDNPQAAKRVSILVDQIDGCDPATSMLLFFTDFGDPVLEQIAGPEADGDIAMRIVGRDIGARPPESAPTPLAESMAKLAADLFPPVAANDNVPQEVRRLLPFATAYGGEIRDKTLFGATVDGQQGQIFTDGDGGQAWFYSARGTRRIDLPAKPKDRFSIDWFSDIDEDMPKETIIKGVFGEGEYTMVSGKPGSGKSVISTDMACHVAAGMEWHGRAVKQGLVVYIAAERKALTKRRMRAFKIRHGVDDIPLMVLGGMLDFTSGLADAKAVIAVIKAAEEVCGHNCVWIIVDTLTRTFGPGDQNTSKDMTKFVLACDTVREGVPGSHLTVIHHTGWAGDRGKGAIDLDGAVDASFLVKKEGGSYVLECDGTNDGDEGVITHFRMEGVQVGEKEGEPTMAPVVVQADGKSAGEHLVASLTGHKAKALEALRRLGADGEAVPQGLWRTAFYGEYPGAETNVLKSRFKRAKDSLVGDGLIIETAAGFCEVEAGT